MAAVIPPPGGARVVTSLPIIDSGRLNRWLSSRLSVNRTSENAFLLHFRLGLDTTLPDVRACGQGLRPVFKCKPRQRPSEQQISDGLYTATTMSEKEQVLSYIAAHPGCTSTGVADVVYGRQKWSGWIFARRDIDTLIDEGLVEERFDQGISKFYAKEAV